MAQIVDIDRYLCTGALIYMSEGLVCQHETRQFF